MGNETDRERNGQGRFSDRIPPETVLDVFRERDDRARPLTASDVVDELGIARRTAHNKLNALVERGELDTRKVGARGRVWWVPIPRDGSDETGEDGASASESGPSVSPDPTPGVEDEPERQATERRETAGEDPETILRNLSLPGRGGKVDARIDAILRMYDHLRERPGETVAKADLLALVDPDGVAYGSVDSFWNNCVKANSSQGRGKNALVALPGVEDWGGGEYRYTE